MHSMQFTCYVIFIAITITLLVLSGSPSVDAAGSVKRFLKASSLSDKAKTFAKNYPDLSKQLWNLQDGAKIESPLGTIVRTYSRMYDLEMSPMTKKELSDLVKTLKNTKILNIRFISWNSAYINSVENVNDIPDWDGIDIHLLVEYGADELTIITKLSANHK